MASVVVTGCNRGIGEGVALVLSHAGYHVIGWNRTLSTVQRPWHEVACDVRLSADVERAAAGLPEDTTAVVANAGIRRFGTVEQLSLDDWRASVETNLDGV